MGQLITGDIQNLIGGISQQPWNVRMPTQGEEQVNCYSSVTEFLRRRPATRHIAKLESKRYFEGCFVHFINRDENEQYAVLLDRSGLLVTDLDGNVKTANISESGRKYLAAAKQATEDFRCLSINDYTFVVNRRVKVKESTELSPTRTPEALVFIKVANYNTTYTVTAAGTTASFTTLDGVAPAGAPADELSSAQIAQALTNGLAANTSLSVQMKNNTIWIRRKDGKDFEVNATDTRSNSNISVFKNKVQRFSDLPVVGPRGYLVEIVGDASSTFDNYFVEFEPMDDNTDFGNGVWRETVKPGISVGIDATTMPHALIRQADGTFTFDVLPWESRSCGDEESSPLPSFVGRTLNGIFFYRNRLSFLSDENVIMSEVGEFFNFFPTTVTTIVDSDPIDVAASHTRNNILQNACVFAGGLLLFSDQCQFVLEHDNVLANSTVSVKPVTEFEASSRAMPVSSGKTVFFATERGEYAGVREYITLPDQTDQNDAADVSAHIPRYIEGNIRNLICSTNEDLLLVLGTKRYDDIYLYKYFWNGSEKIQSSWFKFRMEGDVLGAFFMFTDCYLVIQYSDGVYLEVMSFAPGNKDLYAEYEFCIDRKVTEDKVSVEWYDMVSNTTTITMPYPLKKGQTPLVVSRPAISGDTSYGKVYDVEETISSTRFRVKGNLTDKHLFAGVAYDSEYVFTTLAIRQEQRGSAITTGRLQLRSLTINCYNTGYLELHVTPDFRPTSTRVFTGRELGHGTNILGQNPIYTGSIKCPILSLNTQARISASSDSFLPFALVNATWEGFYNARAQQARI